MTFEELKKHAAENGTQAGVLVSSLAAAMVERGDSDERLLNLVETAKEQGSQGGALLIELLDVMYDLGYDEDILDELWDGCLQQGNQSSAFMKETTEIAEESPAKPIWPPQPTGSKSVKIKNLTSSRTEGNVQAYDVGNTPITKDFIEAFIATNPSSISVTGTYLQSNFHNASDLNEAAIEHSITYEYNDGGASYETSGNKVHALIVNGNFVVLAHNKTSDSKQLTRFTVIDFQKPHSNDLMFFTHYKEQEGVTYINL